MEGSEQQFSAAQMERMMKAQEVILKAAASESIQAVAHKSGVLCRVGDQDDPDQFATSAAAWSAITKFPGTINAELRLRGISDLECFCPFSPQELRLNVQGAARAAP